MWGFAALLVVVVGWVPAATWARASGPAGPAIRFAPTRSYRTGRSPQQVAFADFDGNGTVDLLTTNQGTHTVALLRGRGDGTFRKALEIPAGMVHPLAIATADLNGD